MSDFGKTKVLLFAEFGRTGGTRTYFMQLLDFYKTQNFCVNVVSFFKPDDEVVKRCERAGFTITHFKSYASAYGSYQDFPFFLKKEKDFFRSLVERFAPDIVVSTVGTPGLFLGVHRVKTPGIYILHTYPTSKRKGLLRWLRSKVIRLFLPRGVSYVSVSEFSKEALVKMWGLSPRAHSLPVIPNTNGPVLPEIAPPPGPWNILTVGHVIHYKNPLTWVEVAKQVCEVVPDVTFTWLGEGPDIDICRDIVSKSGFRDRILFPGNVDDVAPYYARAHIYVQLSLIENSPFAVLEAFRRGIPCVLSNAGGLRELAEGGDSAVLVAPSAPDETRAAILGLLDSKKLRETYMQASRESYLRNHSNEDWESRLGELHAVNESRSATRTKDQASRTKNAKFIGRNRPRQHHLKQQ